MQTGVDPGGMWGMHLTHQAFSDSVPSRVRSLRKNAKFLGILEGTLFSNIVLINTVLPDNFKPL